MKRKNLVKLGFLAALFILFSNTACEKKLFRLMVKIPPATEKKIIIEKNVMAPMRDGVKLAADIYRPEGAGKWPVVLIRIPYNKEEMMPMLGKEIARRGYVVIIQDCRGTFKSEGRIFFPLFWETDDGKDTIDWIAKQSWYGGGVGMWGGSYFGYTQWAAAPGNTDLKCFYPLLTTPNMVDAFIIGGAMQYEFTTTWTQQVGKQNEDVANLVLKPDLTGGWYNYPLEPPMNVNFGEISHKMENADAINGILGLNLSISDSGPIPKETFKQVIDKLLPLFSYPSLTYNQPALKFGDRYKDISAPAYSVAGWYDIFLQAQIDDFLKLQKEGKGDAAKKSKLVIGPWGHGYENPMASGKCKLAAQREMLNEFVKIEWFDKWLKGKKDNVEFGAPVKIFVMGANVWRTENEWPLARMKQTNYYLSGGGKANSISGDGALSTELPSENVPPDKFDFDPSKPVPTSGGALLDSEESGVKLQKDVELRNDVLVYSFPVLQEDVEVTGPISAVIYASTSAVDTDWTVKLVDARPDGKIVNIQDGIIRARYREDLLHPSLLTPNEIYKYTIDMWSTSYVFKKGHTIRIEVSSSNFPRFGKNCGLGGKGGPTDFVVAHQTIYHDAKHPSHIVLPIIPKNKLAGK